MPLLDMKRSTLIPVFLAVLLAGGLTGCRQHEIYYTKGVVEEVKLEQKKIRIHHEHIPNYMPAMTMDFDVRNTNELTGLKPGDTVAFRMIVLKDDAWIDRLMKLSNAPAPPPGRPLYRQVREVEELKEGDLLPDYRFTNQLGQAVSLSQFKGQALALTFIYTRCPYPVYCPRMSQNFDELCKRLEALPNAPTNWHLLTITFDPEFDTPRVLTAYAKQYKADPARWSFLTGDLVEITAMGEQFGLTFWRPDPNEPAGINHNQRTVVVDAQGRVKKIFPGNEWKVEEAVAEMVKACEARPGG